MEHALGQASGAPAGAPAVALSRTAAGTDPRATARELPRGLVRGLATAVGMALALAGPALAHDTWFVPQAATDRGERLFALGTGNQFPQLDVAVALKQLQSSGCRGEGQRAAPMRWVADAPAALMLRSARPVPAATPRQQRQPAASPGRGC